MKGISTGAFRQFGGIAGEGLSYDQATIPLDLIDPHPQNRTINEDKVEKLASTIERDGLGQLPLVRAQGDGRFQMISGHHRLAAFRSLAKRTGQKCWTAIPVNVLRECDDERALCLLHMTNLVAPDLTKEEIGRSYEAIAEIVSQERKKDPERFAGVLTNTIVAQISTEQGRPAGITYVKDARKAYRDSICHKEQTAPRPRPVPPRPTEAELAADALQRSIERLDALDVAQISRVSTRLDRYAKRLRSLAKKGM